MQLFTTNSADVERYRKGLSLSKQKIIRETVIIFIIIKNIHVGNHTTAIHFLQAHGFEI